MHGTSSGDIFTNLHILNHLVIIFTTQSFQLNVWCLCFRLNAMFGLEHMLHKEFIEDHNQPLYYHV
jgi:hypothetical protein